MSRFVEIISPIYNDLLAKCERRKISVNLDIQDLSVRINDDEKVSDFYNREIKRAFKLCENGDKITLAQSISPEFIRLSVRSSAKTPLDAETVEKLRADGYEVRSRFGFDTIISTKISC